MPFNIPAFYRCRTCAQCGVTQNNQSMCIKFKIAINPDSDFCSWHQNDAGVKCAFCDATENLFVETINDIPYNFCADHYRAFHSCQGCVEYQNCAFKADRSEPQVVFQTVRQGMMTMQTQIKNPNLTVKHCATCKCHYGDKNCVKDLQDGPANCANWTANLELLI